MRNDQALGLRRMFGPAARRRLGLVGTGTAALALELAEAFACAGRRVLVVDRSRGEIARKLGRRVRYELSHVLAGDVPLGSALVNVAERIALLPGARGCERIDREIALSPAELDSLFDQAMPDLEVAIVNGAPLAADPDADVVLAFAPTASDLTAAYAALKRTVRERDRRRYLALVHGANDDAAGREALASLADTAHRYLGIELRAATGVAAIVGQEGAAIPRATAAAGPAPTAALAF